VNIEIFIALVGVFHPEWLIETSGYAGVTICIQILTKTRGISTSQKKWLDTDLLLFLGAGLKKSH